MAACLAVGVMALAAPALGVPAKAARHDRMHDCGPLPSARFEADMGVRGMSCRRARPLLEGWLASSYSTAGEGLPRSTRRGHWRCRHGIAWSCDVNARDVAMVFSLELRRHGDLWAGITSSYATGPAGETYVDYRIEIRNLGTSVVPARLVDRLPAGLTLVGAAASRGSCGPPDPTGRLRCSIGPVAPGSGAGPVVSIRLAYDCATDDPIDRNAIAVWSPAGDIDMSSNRAYVDELDRVCPDPYADDPLPPDQPDPPADDPAPPDQPDPALPPDPAPPSDPVG